MPEGTKHWSTITLREKLIKIGAKVVRHGRYITFQMAEVAIPRTLFVEILRLIDGLRPAPYRHDSGRSSSIQIARQDRYVRRVPEYALSARNDHWPAFNRQIGSTKRGDRYADCRIRTGFAFDRHFCYATGDCEWSSGESRVE